MFHQALFIPTKMKKIKFAPALAFMALSLFIACGPSAEEKAAKEKATQDSIDAAMATAMEKEIEAAAEVHDSISAGNADSTAAPAAEQPQH